MEYNLSEVDFEKEIKKRIELLLLAMDIKPDTVNFSFEVSPFAGFKVFLSSEDKAVISRVIGRNGKNINAMRTLLSIYSSLRNINVEVIALPQPQKKE